MRARSSARQAGMACATTARSERARLRCSWSSSQADALAFVVDPRRVDGGFQAFGVREPAHRQGRRGQPHQLQQAGVEHGGGAGVSGRACSRGRATWVCGGCGHGACRSWLQRPVRAASVVTSWCRGRARARAHGCAPWPCRRRRRHRSRAQTLRSPRSRSGAWRAACRPAHGRARSSGGRASARWAHGGCPGGRRRGSGRTGVPCCRAGVIFSTGLRCGHHPDQRAVFGHQHIAAAHHGAARQKHAQLRPRESVASKRLFWRTSQSSSTVAARLSSTGREALALGG